MPDGLGARLREARQRRGLSLRSLANALGVSASMVSQVEGGKTQPSVATLYAMANHLGVSLDGLVGNEPAIGQRRTGSALSFENSAVQRGSDNPVIEMENGVRWERIACWPGGPAEPKLVTYEPGASSSTTNKMMRHDGVEYAYVLEGELILHLDFETIALSVGDSLCFDSQRPHMYSNVGDVPARGLWFVVGRSDPGFADPMRPGFAPTRRGAASSAVEVLRSVDEFD